MSTTTRDRIITTARRLFAEHGYDGLSTRAIAKAVGINISTLNYHTGGKGELYMLIFQDVFLKDHDLIMSFCESIDDDQLQDPLLFRDALMQFVNDYLKLAAQQPEVSQLWLRRWLDSPDAATAQLDVNFGTGLYKAMRDLLRRAQANGLLSPTFNMRYFLYGFTWMVHGYFSDGSAEQTRSREDAAADFEAFRQHMSFYVCNMLGLPLPVWLMGESDSGQVAGHNESSHPLPVA